MSNASLVSRTWEEHLRAPFPARMHGRTLAGVDMVMVDADVAGIVSSWLAGGGRLDGRIQSLLPDLVRDLDRVLCLLDDPHEQRYYERLRDLARLVMEDANP